MLIKISTNINIESVKMAETTKNEDVSASDSDKDTDTESLPEVVHSKFVNKSNDQTAWKLHQNVPPAGKGRIQPHLSMGISVI